MAEDAIAPGVATADAWTPSRRMQAAAAAERERVERALARLGAREHELAAELAVVRVAHAELEHKRDVLNQFTQNEPSRSPGRESRRLRALPDAGGPAKSNGHTVLKGACIRETAVRVLAANAAPDAPVHYRDWFELMVAQGFMPAGKDPLATFLTQVGRSPVVQRSTASGVYALDLRFPDRARERRRTLQAQLGELQARPPDMTVEQIAADREQRAQLTAELEETERQLEEALRSLSES